MDAGPAPSPAPLQVLVLALGTDSTAAPLIGVPLIGVPSHHVREVARVELVTEYPGAPDDLSGVTAVRGQIVSVLDLTPRAPGVQAVVLLTAGGRGLALAGATPVRVAEAHPVDGASPSARVRLWSGRVLPLAGGVRLADAARPDADDGRTLPLLDVAALIRDAVVDDPD